MKFRSPEHLLIEFIWADLPSLVLANLGFDTKKNPGSLLQLLHSLICVCKDYPEQADTVREGEISLRHPEPGQAVRQIHITTPVRNISSAMELNQGQKHVQTPWAAGKIPLQAKQSSKMSLCVFGLSAGGQAKQVNSVYLPEQSFINAISLIN